jgi:hypothetical protein
MEFRIYDNLNRKVVSLIAVALTAGVLAAFTTFSLVPHPETRVPTQAYFILIVPAGMILAVFAVMNLMTGATIRIERPMGEVFQLGFLFGLEVRRRRFNLSEFDRVSLSRGFRAGYQVSLVGRDQELKVFLTANLGTARHREEEVAAECGLTVSDQL